MTPPSGLLVLDKPSGPTSFDCVHRIKQILPGVRVGHCGTLDPMAEGVLLVLLGSSTRLQDQFLALEKQYWFRAKWGVKTHTGDREGKVLETRFDGPFSKERIETIVPHFMGETLQTPPRVSAIKYKGKRLYEWTRKGIDVPRLPRPVRLSTLTILSSQGSLWEGRVVCSRGTYIRTLVEDMAERLGALAHLEALVRERVGPYTREQGLTWDRLSAMTPEHLLSLAIDPTPCAALS